MKKVYVNTKRYVVKRTGFFEYSILLDDTTIVFGGYWSMKRVCVLLNGAYLIGISDACIQSEASISSGTN